MRREPLPEPPAGARAVSSWPTSGTLLPGRDRRDDPRPLQVKLLRVAPGPHLRAGGRQPAPHHGRAHRGRHQPGSDSRRWRQGQFREDLVLPAQCGAHRNAAFVVSAQGGLARVLVALFRKANTRSRPDGPRLEVEPPGHGAHLWPIRLAGQCARIGERPGAGGYHGRAASITPRRPALERYGPVRERDRRPPSCPWDMSHQRGGGGSGAAHDRSRPGRGRMAWPRTRPRPWGSPNPI